MCRPGQAGTSRVLDRRRKQASHVPWRLGWKVHFGLNIRGTQPTYHSGNAVTRSAQRYTPVRHSGQSCRPAGQPEITHTVCRGILDLHCKCAFMCSREPYLIPFSALIRLYIDIYFVTLANPPLLNVFLKQMKRNLAFIKCDENIIWY